MLSDFTHSMANELMQQKEQAYYVLYVNKDSSNISQTVKEEIMKRLLTVILSGMIMAAVPAFAADSAQKDECLLYSKECKNQVDSIQQKIKKLNDEIKKGKKTYSAEELKKLSEKLKEANDILTNLSRP
jgi:septal ring factor EnvC (AmiA/AmiB activator)